MLQYIIKYFCRNTNTRPHVKWIKTIKQVTLCTREARDRTIPWDENICTYNMNVGKHVRKKCLNENILKGLKNSLGFILKD